MRDWKSEWFYTRNMIPSLVVHSNAAPEVVDNWEKNSLTAGEVERLRPFFERIGTLKLQGLTGVGIVASFIRRQVQPLMARDHLGFEYTGPEDSSRVVPTTSCEFFLFFYIPSCFLFVDIDSVFCF